MGATRPKAAGERGWEGWGQGEAAHRRIWSLLEAGRWDGTLVPPGLGHRVEDGAPPPPPPTGLRCGALVPLIFV